MKSALCMGAAFFVALIIVIVAYQRVVNRESPKTAELKLASNFSYTAESLRQHVKDNAADAAKYVYPGLFPFDLLLLACLGATMAMLSIGFGVDPAKPAGLWMLLILPVAYMIADLSENFLFASMLTGNPDAVSGWQVMLTKAMTVLKFAFWAAGTVQVLWLAWGAWKGSH